MVEDCIISHSLFFTLIKILIKTYGCMDVAFLTIIKKFERQKSQAENKMLKQRYSY